jgi:hypothetical protein
VEVDDYFLRLGGRLELVEKSRRRGLATEA